MNKGVFISIGNTTLDRFTKFATDCSVIKPFWAMDWTNPKSTAPVYGFSGRVFRLRALDILLCRVQIQKYLTLLQLLAEILKLCTRRLVKAHVQYRTYYIFWFLVFFRFVFKVVFITNVGLWVCVCVRVCECSTERFGWLKNLGSS